MNPAIQPRTSLCATCGEPEDGRTGLCLACLMRSAAAPASADTFDIFGSEGDLPRIGSYELLEKIGSGGMGVIYRARHIRTGRLDAVKKLQDHIAQDPELLSRFRREAKTASGLDHRNVLPIYEVNDEADGVPYFAMKLAGGGSLVDRREQLAGRTREIVTLMAKVARAADHAHNRGVLHRDLKPGNILFDADGEPMVSDFGLATWLHQESDLTRTIMVFGTPGYLPPEYLHGRPEVLKPTSDVYSLGVILFELLAGQLPLAADASLAAIRKAAETPAPRLRTIIPHADRDLEVICARCLELEPSMRYRSAGALAEDLERWLDGRPILARPVSPAVRAWKLARRRPAIAIACVLLLLLSTGVFVLNRSRTQVAAELDNATAYDRSIALLPIEDLDGLSRDTPLAVETTRVCAAAMGGYRDLSLISSKSAPEPLPRHGDLVRFSQTLGARFLLSATVRKREGAIRLVAHVLDAARDVTLHREIIEVATLDEPRLAVSIEALERGIKQGWPLPEGKRSDRAAPDPANDAATGLANSYLLAGDEHFRRHTLADADFAIEAYQKAVRAQPKNAVAKSSLAMAMAVRGMVVDRKHLLGEALKIALEAVQMDPFLDEAHKTLGIVHMTRGEHRKALEESLQAVELDPGDFGVFIGVAEGHFNLGDPIGALLWNAKGSHRDTTPGASALYRGTYLASIGDFQEAKKAFREWNEFRRDVPDGEQWLAVAELLEGNTESALKRIRDLHTVFPTHPVVPQTRACMELLAGDRTVAEKLFREFPDEDAGLATYLSVRGSSALGYLALHGGAESGRELVERALRLDEERLREGCLDGAIVFEKAANLSVLERTDEAFACLNRDAQNAPWFYYKLKLDPRLENLRDDPRFIEVMNASEKRLRGILSQYRNE